MSDPYTAANGDAAIAMLQEVFGKAMEHIVGGNTTGAQSAAANMLGTAFGFFNSGVLFFGAIILTWVTVFGITNTANDGQVLGKKWSTFYTPLRTFTASAFLIPSTSGYSVVQLAILLIVSWSVGFASNMWGKVVDYVVDDGAVEQAVLSLQEDPNFDQLALSVLRMQVCAYGASQGINQTGLGHVNLQPSFPSPDETTSINGRTVLLGAVGGIATAAAVAGSDPMLSSTHTSTIVMKDSNWPGSESICGKLVLANTHIKPGTNSGPAQTVAASVYNAINTVRFSYAMKLFDPNGVVGSIAKDVIKVAESDGPGATISAPAIASKITAIRTQLTAEMVKEIRSNVSSNNATLAQRLKEKGWVYAGSLHRELAQIKDAIRSATSSKTEYVPGSGTVTQLLASGDASNAAQTVMSRYMEVVSEIDKKANPNLSIASTSGKPTLPSLKTSFEISDFTDGGNSIKSMATGFFNKLPFLAMQGIVFYLGEDGSDPVMQVKNVGDYMAAFGETVLLLKATVTATISGITKALEGSSNQPVVGVAAALGAGAAQFSLSLVNELAAVAWPGVMTFLYGGYFLGIWIPMVPFYVFGLGVIGWLVQVVEAMAAGSLWMVMHLTPERDDTFIGSQQQGYLLLMSLFARPPLMVLGVVASMAILTPAVRFINAGFITAFMVIQTDSVTGLLSLGGFMLTYGVIILGVFMMVFSLPQTLPDRILRWIGAGIADLGEQNTMARVESGASGQAKAAALAGAAGMARQDQSRRDREREARRANADNHGEADRVRPEGHTA